VGNGDGVGERGVGAPFPTRKQGEVVWAAEAVTAADSRSCLLFVGERKAGGERAK